jgi:crotonobetainyl-CoA:carnitine CoA-transferase CaiB-like acyl-CoA transferase
MWNRGKRSVVADPTDPADGDRLARRIAGADVLIVNNASSPASPGRRSSPR